jgi:hypothetical protein
MAALCGGAALALAHEGKLVHSKQLDLSHEQKVAPTLFSINGVVVILKTPPPASFIKSMHF